MEITYLPRAQSRRVARLGRDANALSLPDRRVILCYRARNNLCPVVNLHLFWINCSSSASRAGRRDIFILTDILIFFITCIFLINDIVVRSLDNC